MYRIHYVILFAIWGFFLLAVDGNVVRNEDICGPHDGRRLYLELGEQGILYAKNVSLIKNSPRQHQASRVYVTNSSHDQCSLELVTCPSCVITVTFKSLALSHHCSDGGMMMDSPCRCDYVWISEPPYEDVSGTPYCGLYSPITYRSSTRTLSIALLYSQSHQHAFTLEYMAERNRLHLKGAATSSSLAKGINNTVGGILTSPFFPARYPRDLGMEYIVTCPTEAPSCRVRVLFSDFQLATVSIMEFYDWNGQRLDVSSGARFRPPVIVSSGPSLLIRFYANGGTGLGYKAFYSFVLGHLFDRTVQPITDCGGYVENLGGAITMLDMVGQLGLKTYDCVWLIRPPKNFLHMKTHMYLKVVTFADMAGNTELTIKQGPTSALMPLEVLRHPASQLQPPRLREHVAPVTSGFHVSLRGTFGPTSRVAIAYAAFSYMDCFTGSDFLCQNHRCIPSQLNCDGFDHCGDNSDEPATCFRDWELEPQDRKWHMNKANYYFPKIDRYPDLKTATLVFVASSLGLIVLISALIILLYRMGARARQQRELQSRLQTISELLVFDIADGARIDEITVSDDPPVYEAPPGYDEVVKVGMNGNEIRRSRKRKNILREPRSRSSPNQRSRDQEVVGPSNLQTEGANTNRSSQTTPTASSSVPRVPESPPPPYRTPPGTVPRNLDAGRLAESMDTEGVSLRGYRTRRAWLQSSGEFSRSLPAMDVTENAPIGGPSTSVDAEALGAYLQNYASMRSHVRVTAVSGNAAGVPLSVELAPDVPGAYHHQSSTVEQSTSALTNASQLSFCRDASKRARRGYGSDARGHEIINVVPDPEAGDVRPVEIVGIKNQIGYEVANDEEDDDDFVGDVNEVVMTENSDRIVNCSCEGACGCANDDTAAGIYEEVENCVRRRRHRRKNNQQKNNRSHRDHQQMPNDIDSEIVTHESGETSARRNNSESEAVCPKSAIIRLLGSSRSASRNSQNCSLNSTTVSTASSTPSGSYGRAFGRHASSSFRKVSICSRDSHVTKMSILSSCHSSEKLHDEFEIVSETASILGTTSSNTLANTPIGTPRFVGNSSRSNNRQHRRRLDSLSSNRRPSLPYSSCDLESLYDSIKALDTFIARRGMPTKQTKNQSVAVMLFGTPEHNEGRNNFGSSSSSYPQEPNEATGFINGSRSWRSTDDAFSN